MTKLVEPTETYIRRVQKSSHFLNKPKNVLNDVLDSLYRQGVNDGKSLEYVTSYLKERGFTKSTKLGKEFVEWRSTITMAEFSSFNDNWGDDEIPQSMLNELDRQVAWCEAMVKWKFGIKWSTPSFPYPVSVV